MAIPSEWAGPPVEWAGLTSFPYPALPSRFKSLLNASRTRYECSHGYYSDHYYSVYIAYSDHYYSVYIAYSDQYFF